MANNSPEAVAKTNTYLKSKNGGNNPAALLCEDKPTLSGLASALFAVKGISLSADHSDPESLRKCYYAYIQKCIDEGIILGNMAAYAAMGISKDVAYQWRNGVRKANDPRYRELIEEIDRDMAVYRESLAANNMVNVAWLIFSAKNFDGMRDQVDIAPVAVDPLGERRSSAEIAEKYKNVIED